MAPVEKTGAIYSQNMGAHMASKRTTILDFVGTHSSGKTTIIERVVPILKQFGCTTEVISSVSRTDLNKVKIYSDVDEFSQSYISIVNWGNIISRNDVDFVLCTDLCIRGFAYMLAAKQIEGKVLAAHKQFLDFFRSQEFQFIRNPIWFYLPIEFKMASDGVRPEDEEYRQEVDRQINYLFKSCKIPHVTLYGTVEERLKQAIQRIVCEIK